MAEHHDFHFFGVLGAKREHDEFEQTTETPVEKRQQSELMGLGASWTEATASHTSLSTQVDAKGLVIAVDRVFGTHTSERRAAMR